MFASASRFVLTAAILSFLVLFTTFAAAAPLARHGNGNGTHSRLEKRDGNGNGTHSRLEKRDGNARFTYYDAGQNACGGYDSNTDYIMALSPSMFNNGAHCYKTVTIQYNGQQVQAKVTDECPGCKDAQADLSRPLFAHLAPLDEGVIYGNWWFN